MNLRGRVMNTDDYTVTEKCGCLRDTGVSSGLEVFHDCALYKCPFSLFSYWLMDWRNVQVSSQHSHSLLAFADSSGALDDAAQSPADNVGTCDDGTEPAAADCSTGNVDCVTGTLIAVPSVIYDITEKTSGKYCHTNIFIKYCIIIL